MQHSSCTLERAATVLRQRTNREEATPSKRTPRPSITWSAVAVLVLSAVRSVALAQRDGGVTALDLAEYSLSGLIAAATAVVVLDLLAGAIDPPANWVLLAFHYCVGLVPAVWVMFALTSAVAGEGG